MQESVNYYPLRQPRSQNLTVLLIASFLLPFCVIYFGFKYAGVFGLHWGGGGEVPVRERSLASDIFNSTLGFEKVLAISQSTTTDHNRNSISLAAALSAIDLEWIDGARSKNMYDQLLPNGLSNEREATWRSHINAILTIVQRNLTSALIIEDSADWDIRLRPQLANFARASRALIQPLAFNLGYADSTYPTESGRERSKDIIVGHVPYTIIPTVSPYGDDWELLWLGHCGADFPKPSEGDQIPLGRAKQLDDSTVPEKRFLNNEIGSHELLESYPPHTRVVHHVNEVKCPTAYAVTQAGARKILYELGVKQTTGDVDGMMSQFCQGKDGHLRGNCLTVQPQLFSARQRGSNMSRVLDSEASERQDRTHNPGYTEAIRQSIRLNFHKILNGESDYLDQWPDEDKGEEDGPDDGKEPEHRPVLPGTRYRPRKLKEMEETN